MNRKLLAALIAVGFAIPAFALSRVIWPDPPGAPTPPASLLPFLLVPAVFEALAFGAGVAFLVFGGRLLQQAGQAPALTLVTYLAIAWSLLNWWPHVNFHRAIGPNLVALVEVDWGFHLTLIISAVVIAIFFVRVLSSSRERQPALAV
ncbi:MAG TPA: hypothetical protein VE953_26440 [Terriglobales bacterium]|nr:hypothetical protein [Terriglobales bacterium]